jgi:hypothetical protein
MHPLIINRNERMIIGRAVSYSPSIGTAPVRLPSRVPRRSLTWDSHPLVLIEHDSSLRVGRVDEFFDFPRELWVTLQMSSRSRGDRGLAYAERANCGLSIGLADDAKFRIAEDGVNECVSARIVEITLTCNPVFR